MTGSERRRRMKGYAWLAGLTAFVAYFGVWHLARFLEAEYGLLWALAAALPAALGLAVIVVVGLVMIRTRTPAALHEDEIPHPGP